MEKRYYWLKLYSDFFESKRIKKLRKINDVCLVIYLKMQLKSLSTGGVIEYTGIEDDFASEIALDINEKPSQVQKTIDYLLQNDLLVQEDEDTYVLPWVEANTGSESASTLRVRDFRSKQKAIKNDMLAAENECKEKQYIPCILNHMNRVRYGGNYYIVCRRDGFKCAMCGSIEQLCVHHIDGYDENKPENNQANKMVLLCRSCHSKVHSNSLIPNSVLESIGYFDDVTRNADETRMKRIGYAEKEIEIDIDKDIKENTKRKQNLNKEPQRLRPKKNRKNVGYANRVITMEQVNVVDLNVSVDEGGNDEQ